MIQWPMLVLPPLNLWNYPKQSVEYKYVEKPYKPKIAPYLVVSVFHGAKILHTRRRAIPCG